LWGRAWRDWLCCWTRNWVKKFKHHLARKVRVGGAHCILSDTGDMKSEDTCLLIYIIRKYTRVEEPCLYYRVDLWLACKALTLSPWYLGVWLWLLVEGSKTDEVLFKIWFCLEDSESISLLMFFYSKPVR
jgi:hypothetical protein